MVYTSFTCTATYVYNYTSLNSHTKESHSDVIFEPSGSFSGPRIGSSSTEDSAELESSLGEYIVTV